MATAQVEPSRPWLSFSQSPHTTSLANCDFSEFNHFCGISVDCQNKVITRDGLRTRKNGTLKEYANGIVYKIPKMSDDNCIYLTQQTKACSAENTYISVRKTIQPQNNSVKNNNNNGTVLLLPKIQDRTF